jgi:hypothetical protein
VLRFTSKRNIFFLEVRDKKIRVRDIYVQARRGEFYKLALTFAG